MRVEALPKAKARGASIAQTQWRHQVRDNILGFDEGP